ncbi:MAG: DUF2505 domain-containing protein [Acidimicrobiales bacterium]
MRFEIEQRFTGALEVVEAAFTDPDFLTRLAALPKLGQPELLDRSEDGKLVLMSVRYHFVGDISSAVRAVVDPSRLVWIEESTLDRTTHMTTWTIVPEHYGGLLRSSGTYELRDLGDGSVLRRATGELKVSVPLVGGRVERAIVSGLEEHAALEEDVMSEFLAST